MQTTRSLLKQMERSQSKSPAKTSRSRTMHRSSIRSAKIPKVSLERDQAQIRYKKLTNLTKSEQLNLVQGDSKERKVRNPEWKYGHYHVNNTFSVFQKHRGVQKFPHNNVKYNTQFLDKTLQGGRLNFTVRDIGFFPKAQDQLYSDHFKPIVVEKRKYNEDYQLRASLYGKIELDLKRDKILDQYQLQTNPFSTKRSNQLISTMRSARKHRFS